MSINTGPVNHTTTTTLGALLVGFGAGLIVMATKETIKSILRQRYPGIFVANRQQKSDVDEETVDLVAAAEDIIQASYRNMPGGNCVLATIDADSGGPRVRPINPMKYDLRGKEPYVVFFTNRLSRKYRELQKDSRVELNFLNPDGIGYVSLTGSVIELPHLEAQKFWVNRMSYFLPEGPAGEQGRYTVFQLKPNKLELFCMRLGLSTVCHKDWDPWRMVFSRGSWLKPQEALSSSSSSDEAA